MRGRVWANERAHFLYGETFCLRAFQRASTSPSAVASYCLFLDIINFSLALVARLNNPSINEHNRDFIF